MIIEPFSFRIHQRSVEVAHQRLEEYQRALRIRYNMSTRSLMPAVVPLGLVPPSLHRAQPEHLPAPPHLPTSSAVPAYIYNRPHISVEDATRDSDVLASLPRLASSVSNGSKLLSDESVSIAFRNQRPDVAARLTDSIMERVTEHLPERLKPSSVPGEHLPHKLFPTHHSTSVPLQPTSDPIRVIGPSISDSVPLDPGLQSQERRSTEEIMEKQRRELREVQRRLLEQREAVALQQMLQEEERRRQEEQRQSQQVEMEQMRRQKETLQALIDADQVSGRTAAVAKYTVGSFALEQQYEQMLRCFGSYGQHGKKQTFLMYFLTYSQFQTLPVTRRDQRTSVRNV